jgi:hypothetical protein
VIQRFIICVLCVGLTGCGFSGVRLIEPVGSGVVSSSAQSPAITTKTTATLVTPAFDELYTAPLTEKTEVRVAVTREPNFHFTITVPELTDPPAGQEYGVWLFRVEPMMARQVGVLQKVVETHNYAVGFAPLGDWGDFDRVILTRQIANRRVPFSAVTKLREVILSSQKL